MQQTNTKSRSSLHWNSKVLDSPPGTAVSEWEDMDCRPRVKMYSVIRAARTQKPLKRWKMGKARNCAMECSGLPVILSRPIETRRWALSLYSRKITQTVPTIVTPKKAK